MQSSRLHKVEQRDMTYHSNTREVMSLGAVCELSARLKKSYRSSIPGMPLPDAELLNDERVWNLADTAFAGDKNALLEALSSPLDFLDQVGEKMNIRKPVSMRNHNSIPQRASATTLASALSTSVPSTKQGAPIFPDNTADTTPLSHAEEYIHRQRPTHTNKYCRPSQCSSRASSQDSNCAAVDRELSFNPNFEFSCFSGANGGNTDVWRNVRDTNGQHLFFPRRNNAQRNRQTAEDSALIASRVRRFGVDGEHIPKTDDNKLLGDKKRVTSNTVARKGGKPKYRQYSREFSRNNKLIRYNFDRNRCKSGGVDEQNAPANNRYSKGKAKPMKKNENTLAESMPQTKPHWRKADVQRRKRREPKTDLPENENVNLLTNRKKMRKRFHRIKNTDCTERPPVKPTEEKN